jgi:predicted metal-binding protein
MKSELKECLARAGVFAYGEVDPRDVEFTEEVRGYCAQNTCGQYGKTWACPPAVGTVDECRERARRYDRMLVFSGKYDIESSFDFEGMASALMDFKTIVNALDADLQARMSGYLLLGNEGCGNCKACTYPGSPCRFPDKLHHSIEGYGIYVTKLAQQAGIAYHNGENTVTFFGALLYDATMGRCHYALL